MKRKRGLSLVELMAAIVIMGLIALAGVRLLSSAMENWRRETVRMVEQRRVQDAADRLQADLQALTLQPGAAAPTLDFDLCAAPGIVCAFHTFPMEERAPVAVAYLVVPSGEQGWDLWRVQADPKATLDALPEHAAMEAAASLLAGGPESLVEDERAALILGRLRALGIRNSPEGMVEFYMAVLLPQGEAQMEGDRVPATLLRRHGIHESRKLRIPTHEAAAL